MSDPTEIDIQTLEDFPSKDVFSTKTEYPALRIPARETAKLRKRLNKQTLNMPRMKNVYEDTSDPKQCRILVLGSTNALKDDAVRKVIDESDGAITETSRIIETSYDFLTAEEALKIILQDKVKEVPSAFEIIGNIAHVNLHDESLPYKYWIGKVILDKNTPRIRTVVNKVGTIDTVYRTFGMEVIAGFEGKDWSIVSVKEERSIFSLDFRQVYWNSRLAGEHKRLVRYIHSLATKDKNVVVADVMAGVGPFAVPLTAHNNPHNVIVHANDLNPASYKFLKINSQKNKCDNLTCYNEDGRVFVHRLQKECIPVQHYLMNLPASAPEFLDAFRGYRPISKKTNDSIQQQTDTEAKADDAVLPRIHVHCFAPKTAEKENFYQCAVDRCALALGCSLDRERDQVEIHVVRDVSPGKNMLCVSFQLPQAVLHLPSIELDNGTDGNDKKDESDERSSKRVKTD